MSLSVTPSVYIFLGVICSVSFVSLPGSETQPSGSAASRATRPWWSRGTSTRGSTRRFAESTVAVDAFVGDRAGNHWESSTDDLALRFQAHVLIGSLDVRGFRDIESD